MSTTTKQKLISIWCKSVLAAGNARFDTHLHSFLHSFSELVQLIWQLDNMNMSTHTIQFVVIIWLALPFRGQDY